MKAAFGLLAAFLLFAVSGTHAQQKPIHIRVGYFPNITHAQALVGRAGGQFEKAVGPGVQIEWKAFNAGPSAIEALFANAIDLTYVGPNPAVTGYVRSQGEAVRVIAGAASGGASLVVRQAAGEGRRRSGLAYHERGPVHALLEGAARRGLGSRAVGGAPGS
jgi:NitT/TauT family transport system substrate-binding protein